MKKTVINEKDVKRLLEGTDAMVMATTNGVGFVGSKIEILYLISQIASYSQKSSIDKEEFLTAVNIGLEGDLDKALLELTRKLLDDFIENMKDEEESDK